MRAAQRRMLRWMLGAGRRQAEVGGLQASDASTETVSSDDSSDLEPEPEEVEEDATIDQESWVDIIQRTTHIAEEHLRRIGLDDWVTAQRKKKWYWAGHLARRTDGRWSTKLVTWCPSQGARHQGHPRKRWVDDLDAFFLLNGALPKGSWVHVAQDRDLWRSLEADFVRQAWYT